MNLRNLQLLLEAVAVTVCLIWIAGQPAEAKTITSKVAINTLHRSLNDGTALTVEQNLLITLDKVNSITGEISKNLPQVSDQ